MAELGRMHTVSPEERRKLAREAGSSTPLGNPAPSSQRVRTTYEAAYANTRYTEQRANGPAGDQEPRSYSCWEWA